jgi:hypothetical protein
MPIADSTNQTIPNARIDSCWRTHSNQPPHPTVQDTTHFVQRQVAPWQDQRDKTTTTTAPFERHNQGSSQTSSPQSSSSWVVTANHRQVDPHDNSLLPRLSLCPSLPCSPRRAT